MSMSVSQTCRPPLVPSPRHHAAFHAIRGSCAAFRSTNPFTRRAIQSLVPTGCASAGSTNYVEPLTIRFIVHARNHHSIGLIPWRRLTSLSTTRAASADALSNTVRACAPPWLRRSLMNMRHNLTTSWPKSTGMRLRSLTVVPSKLVSCWPTLRSFRCIRWECNGPCQSKRYRDNRIGCKP